jgi:hypothetical protein
MNLQEALSQWKADADLHAARGIVMPNVRAYLPDGFKQNIALAMDAQPALTTDPNSAVPFFLTSFMDPEVIRIRFSPNKAAEIAGEQKKGSWVDTTAFFHTVEHTGEVSSYGDFNENGHAGVNQNWPQRQQYLYQAVKEYGELEIERAGLGKINYVAETDQAAATVMNKFENLTYFFGVTGLQNFGLLNDPQLSAALTPATKAAGGTGWFTAGGAPNATANEVYNDIVALFAQLVKQTAGLVEKEDALTLAMSPGSSVALTFTNTFNVNVSDLLKKNFPNLVVKTAVQYGAKSSTNTQGNAAGTLAQMISTKIDGQGSLTAAFGEKMRGHPIIRAMSSFRQKITGGTWGVIWKMPLACSQIVGI